MTFELKRMYVRCYHFSKDPPLVEQAYKSEIPTHIGFQAPNRKQLNELVKLLNNSDSTDHTMKYMNTIICWQKAVKNTYTDTNWDTDLSSL